MARTRDEYENTLRALGICIALRIPVLIWGDPGSGKTAAIESAANIGWHVETLIVSHYEPSDFAGLPVLHEGSVKLAPPAWAVRLVENKGPAIAFFDEFSTASPALQAAVLRPLTHYQVGDLQLPQTVAFVAAANPIDVAAAGWELAPPTASRFVHLDWKLPLDVYSECLVTGDWPTLPIPDLPDDFDDYLGQERTLVSGFLHARSGQLSVIPKTEAERGRAFPTPRTWDYAAKLAALAKSVGANRSIINKLVSGCVGAAVAHEFLAWTANLDLPDPEAVLAGRVKFRGLRADRAYVVLQSVLAAVLAKPTPARWKAALVACSHMAEVVGVDPAVPIVRALLRPGVRPEKATLPPEIKVFAPVLSLAGLL